MKMNIFFLICVAFISVSGQFLETEYNLDSVPLPVRRRLNSAQYEIQPSIGREIEFSTEPAKISNQGRRHIQNNRRGNSQNGQTIRNVDDFELKPYQNIYQPDDRNYETRPTNGNINNNERQQEYSDNQYSAPLQEQNEENHFSINIQQNNRNRGNLQQNHRNEDINLKTNLNNPQYTHQSNSQNQPNYPSISNVRTNENTATSQIRRVYEDSRQSGPQANTNIRNLDRTFLNQDNQPNYASNDNIQISQNPTNQQPHNSRTNNNSENVNKNRHAEASQRAIDSNSYSQQNIDSTNNYRNHKTKPSRQNPDTIQENNNRNYEIGHQTTEPTRKITVDAKSVTGGTKSTEDNELASKSHPEGRIGNNDDDKWIWSNTGGKTTKTTIEPTNPTVDDRAAFSGDKCPSGQVKFNGKCVDID